MAFAAASTRSCCCARCVQVKTRAEWWRWFNKNLLWGNVAPDAARRRLATTAVNDPVHFLRTCAVVGSCRVVCVIWCRVLWCRVIRCRVISWYYVVVSCRSYDEVRYARVAVLTCHLLQRTSRRRCAPLISTGGLRCCSRRSCRDTRWTLASRFDRRSSSTSRCSLGPFVYGWSSPAHTIATHRTSSRTADSSLSA